MESSSDRFKERVSSHGEGALGELAQALLDNPWFNQAIHVALEARERASQAGVSAMRNLNLPTGADLDRLGRRLRSMSERLEGVEDGLCAARTHGACLSQHHPPGVLPRHP